MNNRSNGIAFGGWQKGYDNVDLAIQDNQKVHHCLEPVLRNEHSKKGDHKNQTFVTKTTRHIRVGFPNTKFVMRLKPLFRGNPNNQTI